MICVLQSRYIPGLNDLHRLYHVAGWEAYNLHDTRGPRFEPVLHRSRTAYHKKDIPW